MAGKLLTEKTALTLASFAAAARVATGAARLLTSPSGALMKDMAIQQNCPSCFFLTRTSLPPLAALLQQALAGLSCGCLPVLDCHDIVLRRLHYVLATGCECHGGLGGKGEGIELNLFNRSRLSEL